MGKVLVKIIGLRNIKLKDQIGIGSGVSLTYHWKRKRNRLIISIKRRALCLENGGRILLETGLPLLME